MKARSILAEKITVNILQKMVVARVEFELVCQRFKEELNALLG